MAEREPIEADEVGKPELSIREELEAARDEVVARQESSDVSGEQTGPDRAGTPTDRGDGRTARGQFAAKQGADNAGQAPAAQAAGPQDAGGSTGAQAVPAVHGQSAQPVALPAPNGWKAEEKELWATVPPKVQHIIQRRETDVARKIAEQDEVRLVGNQFMQTANEYAPLIQARGGNPVALFREFLGIVHQIQN